jgi:hypothetical protein
VPAFLKVIENVPPLEIGPLSKVPASAVTVCVRPWFVQVTVVPALTAAASGLNAKSTIDTAFAAAGVAAAVGVADGVAVGAAVDVGEGLAAGDASVVVAWAAADGPTEGAILGEAPLAHPATISAAAAPRATSQLRRILITTAPTCGRPKWCYALDPPASLSDRAPGRTGAVTATDKLSPMARYRRVQCPADRPPNAFMRPVERQPSSA